MRRRIYIEFVGKDIVRLTNYLRQTTIDLKKRQDTWIDLVSFETLNSGSMLMTPDNSGFCAYIGSQFEIHARSDSGGKYMFIGCCEPNEFWRAKDNKKIRAVEGAFEATVI